MSKVKYSVNREVVVAQVVEQQHSVCADRVQIPGRTLAFFQFRIAVNLFSLGVGLFIIMRTLPSSFLFPIIIYHCENYQLSANNVPREKKEKINPKRGRERPKFKKNSMVRLRLRHEVPRL